MKNKRNQPLDEDTISIETKYSQIKSDTKKSIKTAKKAQIVKEKTTPIDTAPSFKKRTTLMPKNPQYWSKLFWLLVIFSVSWLIYSTLVSIINAWQKNEWLGIPLAVIASAFIIVLLRLIIRERGAFKRVDANKTLREHIQRHLDNNSVAGIHLLLKPRLAQIKKYYPKEVMQFNAARTDRHCADDYISLLDNVLLAHLDKEANKAIKKASLSIAALVAISPHPALDAILVLFRANMLIRRVSQIYGLEPTGLSSLYLLKYTLVSALVAAGIEEVSTLIAEEISMGLSEKAAKLIAEGAVSSARLYRLGHLTKKMIRPIALKK